MAEVMKLPADEPPGGANQPSAASNNSFHELNSLKTLLGKTWSELSNVMTRYHAQIVEKHQELEVTSLCADATRISRMDSDLKMLRTENGRLVTQILDSKSENTKLRTENRKLKDEVTMKDTLIEKIQNQMTQEALDYQAELASLKEILEARSRGAEVTAPLITSPDAQPAKRRKVSQQSPAPPKGATVQSPGAGVSSRGTTVTPVRSDVTTARSDVTPARNLPSTSSESPLRNDSVRKLSSSKASDLAQSGTEDNTSHSGRGFVKLDEVTDESNLDELEGILSEQESELLTEGQAEMTVYYVVVFLMDNSIGIVSDHWRAVLVKPKVKDECPFFWPPSEIVKQVSKMKKALEQHPVTQGDKVWDGPFSARVISISDNYDEAVKKSTKAKFTSDVDSGTEAEQGSGKRNRAQSPIGCGFTSRSPVKSPSPPRERYRDFVSSSENSGITLRQEHQQQNNPHRPGTVRQVQQQQNNPHRPGTVRQVQQQQNNPRRSIFEQETIGYLTTINAKADSNILKLNRVLATIQAIKLRMDPDTASDDDEEIGLPCTTVPLLEDLNRRLSTKAFMDKMVRRMLVYGGRKAKDTTYAVLAAIFGHQLSLGFTRTGAGETKSFQSLEFAYKLVQGAVRCVHARSPPTNTDLDGYISRWFGARKDRSGGRAMRAKRRGRGDDGENRELD